MWAVKFTEFNSYFDPVPTVSHAVYNKSVLLDFIQHCCVMFRFLTCMNKQKGIYNTHTHIFKHRSNHLVFGRFPLFGFCKSAGFCCYPSRCLGRGAGDLCGLFYFDYACLQMNALPWSTANTWIQAEHLGFEQTTDSVAHFILWTHWLLVLFICFHFAKNKQVLSSKLW